MKSEGKQCQSRMTASGSFDTEFSIAIQEAMTTPIAKLMCRWKNEWL